MEEGELKVDSRVTGGGGGDLDQESEASSQEGSPTLPLLQLAPVVLECKRKTSSVQIISVPLCS